MSKAPRVSIGMPVYNASDFIRASLESLLGQTFSDFELIISDNASTDDTLEVCRDYSQRDSRVRLYRSPINHGANWNYNTTFVHSRGEYFKWCSSNDICDKVFLDRCVEILDSRPDVVLCYPKTRLFSRDPTYAEDYEDNLCLLHARASERFKQLLLAIRLNNVMNGLIRRRVLGYTKLMKNYYSSDVVLMAELALHGKFYEVPEYLFYRRMDEQSATKLKSEKEVVSHYEPRRSHPMVLQEWRQLLGRIGATTRARIPLSEKLRTYAFIARLVVWSHRKLTTDLVDAVCLTPTLLAAKLREQKRRQRTPWRGRLPL